MKLVAQIHPRIPVIVLERHHAGRRLPLVPEYLSCRRSKRLVVGLIFLRSPIRLELEVMFARARDPLAEVC